MDKIKIQVKEPKYAAIDFGGQEILVKTRMHTYEMGELISNYLEIYLEKDWDALLANLFLKKEIISRYTNIDVDLSIEELTNLVSFTDIYFHVKSRIENFAEFEKELQSRIFDAKQKLELENSIGKLVSNIGEKIVGILDNFSNITPEQLESLKKTANEMMAEIKDSEIIKETKKSKRKSI